MTARLPLSFFLALSLYAQCTEPKGRLGTTFVCTTARSRLLGPAEAYLLQRVRDGEVVRAKDHLEAHNKAETVVVWMTTQADGGMKLRVEVRPADSATLLGESADTARALRSHLQRALQ